MAAGALLSAASVAGDQSAFSDFRSERPGVMHRISVADLPAPFAPPSARSSPQVVPRPADAKPQALPGDSVALYADGLENPHLMRTAPNGDVFVAESRPGRVKVVVDERHVWGRPVGVAMARLVSDDRPNAIWRVSHTGT
jgi:glucose/arabinose dehydrogenase